MEGFRVQRCAELAGFRKLGFGFRVLGFKGLGQGLAGPKPKDIKVETFRINHLTRSPKS